MHSKIRFGVGLLLTIFILVMGQVSVAYAATYYVNDAVGVSGIGTSWAEAFKTIEEATANADLVGGDDIWVAGGTYALAATIEIDDAIALYGGFDGTETAVGQRDILANPTTIDGGGSVFHCINITVVTAGMGTVTIDGFTITGGDANGGTTPEQRGGGITSLVDTDLIIANCIFDGNDASDGGGAINIFLGTMAVTNCSFIDNNTSGANGGALRIVSADVSVEYSVFTINGAANFGGAIFTGSGLDISKSTFTNNAASDGAGIYVSGGIFVMTNVVLDSNSAAGFGGALFASGTSHSVINCTLYNNSATTNGGGIALNSIGETLTVVNSILDGNTSGGPIDIFTNGPGVEFAVSFSKLDQTGDGLVGENGNIDDDPLFEAAAIGDFHLESGSPCLNTGTATGAPDSDIEDTARPQAGAWDMGAYEGADADGDGIADGIDNCPDVANPDQDDADDDGFGDLCEDCDDDPDKTEAGICGCGVADDDTDGDGTVDCNDACPSDPDKTEAGLCGCGVADTDSDSDGTPDCTDECDADPDKTEEGVCGCGVAETDSDGDGTPDCTDECDADPDKTEAGACGCGVADTDTDGDGTLDCMESCDDDPNKTDPGVCGCGVADTDTDGDGALDCNETCDNDPDKTDPGDCGCGIADTDTDGDGTADCNDECPADPLKTDPGCEGCGVAEVDSDGDGASDCIESCDDDPNKTEPGQCGCGTADTDTDSDGTADCNDAFPDDDTETSDNDGDGTGDNADTDDDNDGVSDAEEAAGPNGGDANEDGTSDAMQAYVASIETADASDYIVLEADPGLSFAECASSELPADETAPENIAFPLGFFSFKITGVTPGGTASVTMTLPAGLSIEEYYKLDMSAAAGSRLTEFNDDGTTGAVVSGNTVTLNFVDGGRGDADATANGEIDDPGAPADDITAGNPGGGGGGGGCFIGSAL